MNMEWVKMICGSRTGAFLCVSAALIVFQMAVQMAVAGSESSDARKKEIVYKMYAGYKKDFPAVTYISPQEAMELLKKKEIEST
jgi:hypothetical protein